MSVTKVIREMDPEKRLSRRQCGSKALESDLREGPGFYH